MNRLGSGEGLCSGTSRDLRPALAPTPPLRQSRTRSQDERTIAIHDRSIPMADRLNGTRILILETREEAQFSKLLAEQGAEVVQCPMFTIQDAPDPDPVEAWIRRAIDKPFDDLVLMTGEGLRRIMKLAVARGLDQGLVAALARSRRFTRG